MYQEHDIFIPPDNYQQKLWRYLSFEKILDLINSQSLFFTRSDMFDDRFEGSLPLKSVKKRTEYYKYLNEAKLMSPNYDPDFWGKYNQSLKKEMAINCWHMNDHESAAMWDLYLKTDEGFAIQTTFAKLRDGFSKVPISIFIGKVRYINYDSETVDINNLLSPYVHKRLSFAHENELRCLIWNADIESPYSLESGGVKIPITISEVIENIYISPKSPLWITNLIKDILDKFNIKIPVINSSLNNDPLY